LRAEELTRSARPSVERKPDGRILAGAAEEQGQPAVDLHDDAAAILDQVGMSSGSGLELGLIRKPDEPCDPDS